MMHIPSAVVFGLAATGALASPFSLFSREKENKEECHESCVTTFIRPFVMAAGEEGFRQALGAHDTTFVCMENFDCRDAVQTFVEEITDMVIKDRVDDKYYNKPYHWPDGYHGPHCDGFCLVLTAQTAAGQAGVVAMAVGQKHFYSDNPLWNRWAPRQMIRLEDAMRQLNGLDKLGSTFPSRDGRKTKKDGRLMFDHTVFRYQGTTEASLLNRRVKREEAQKILSHVAGYGVNMKHVNSTELNKGFLNGWAYYEFNQRLSGMHRAIKGDRGPSEGELKAQTDAVRTIIDQEGGYRRKGWLYFLYERRLSGPNIQESTMMVPLGSWRRLLQDAYMKLVVADPANLEAVDVDQALNRHWPGLVYGGDDRIRSEIQDDQKSETMRLAQWVTDSEMVPLKDVGDGLTHQPWTVPWFYEYSSNHSSMAGLRPDMTPGEAEAYMEDYRKTHGAPLLIRGYMREFKLNTMGSFSPFDLFADNGAIRDFDTISPELPTGDYSPLYAVTADGHVLVRWTTDHVQLENYKMSWEVLDHEKKPLYTEKGDPITIIYDKETGLLETRYGKPVIPLDKDMKAWP